MWEYINLKAYIIRFTLCPSSFNCVVALNTHATRSTYMWPSQNQFMGKYFWFLLSKLFPPSSLMPSCSPSAQTLLGCRDRVDKYTAEIRVRAGILTSRQRQTETVDRQRNANGRKWSAKYLKKSVLLLLTYKKYKCYKYKTNEHEMCIEISCNLIKPP